MTLKSEIDCVCAVLDGCDQAGPVAGRRQKLGLSWRPTSPRRMRGDRRLLGSTRLAITCKQTVHGLNHLYSENHPTFAFYSFDRRPQNGVPGCPRRRCALTPTSPCASGPACPPDFVLCIRHISVPRKLQRNGSASYRARGRRPDGVRSTAAPSNAPFSRGEKVPRSGG